MNKEKMEKIYGEILWTDKPRNFLGMGWNFTRYILTDKKLVVRKGFLNLTEDKVELYRIMDTRMNITLGERIFGCGSILILSKDVTQGKLLLSKVKNPHEVHNLIEETVENQKREYGILGKDMLGAAMDNIDVHMPPPPPPKKKK